MRTKTARRRCSAVASGAAPADPAPSQSKTDRSIRWWAPWSLPCSAKGSRMNHEMTMPPRRTPQGLPVMAGDGHGLAGQRVCRLGLPEVRLPPNGQARDDGEDVLRDQGHGLPMLGTPRHRGGSRSRCAAGGTGKGSRHHPARGATARAAGGGVASARGRRLADPSACPAGPMDVHGQAGRRRPMGGGHARRQMLPSAAPSRLRRSPMAR